MTGLLPGAAEMALFATAAAFGLAALLAVQPAAFAALQWAGAAWRAWLGLGLLRRAWRGAPESAAVARRALGTHGGLLVIALALRLLGTRPVLA